MSGTGYSRFLRQYMREPQRHHQLVEAEETDSRTMQLFPTRAGGTSSHEQQDDAAKAKATLTIFYEGRMLVFEEFPADKAKALMQLAAGSSGSSAAPKDKDAPAPVVRVGVPEKPPATAPLAVPSDLPIARKVSLQRFLQKRKERIAATEPYPKPKAAAFPAAPEKDVPATGTQAAAAPWLGL